MPEARDETVERAAIRIEIDGAWMARDLVRAVRAVDRLYSIRVILQELHDEWRPIQDELKRRGVPSPYWPWYRGWPHTLPTASDLLRVSRRLPVDEALHVEQLEYASPGVIIVAGVAAVALPLTALLNHWLTRGRRRLEDGKIRAETRKLNADASLAEREYERKYFEPLEDLRYPKVGQREVLEGTSVYRRSIKRLIERGQITRVKLLPEKASSEDSSEDESSSEASSSEDDEKRR